MGTAIEKSIPLLSAGRKPSHFAGGCPSCYLRQQAPRVPGYPAARVSFIVVLRRGAQWFGQAVA